LHANDPEIEADWKVEVNPAVMRAKRRPGYWKKRLG